MKIKTGTNFTVFLLFFGIAILEAFQTQSMAQGYFLGGDRSCIPDGG